MKLKQIDLWGEPIEAEKPRTEIMTLDFETQAVRLIMIKGEPWWVLSDVARILEYPSASHAARNLRDKDKGIHRMYTLGGTQDLGIVSEPGLYRLIMRSNKPEAERFQDWVTDEVLPALRKGRKPRSINYGVDRWKKELHCDHKTAELRERKCSRSKATAGRLKSEGAVRDDYIAVHTGLAEGQFGDGCTPAELRSRLGVKKTHLNYMDAAVLSISECAHATAEKQIQLQKTPLKDQPALFKATARKLSQSALATIGAGCHYGITEDPSRGKIIDVVLQLEGPK